MDKKQFTEKKQEAYELGLKAEQLAMDYYVTQGYAILEHRWKPEGSKGEIDIIAQKGDTVVFVEVKARTEGLEEALEAVDARKRRSMAIGADRYLRTMTEDYRYRFDVFAVWGSAADPHVHFVPDAFESPLFSR